MTENSKAVSETVFITMNTVCHNKPFILTLYQLSSCTFPEMWLNNIKDGVQSLQTEGSTSVAHHQSCAVFGSFTRGRFTKITRIRSIAEKCRENGVYYVKYSLRNSLDK